MPVIEALKAKPAGPKRATDGQQEKHLGPFSPCLLGFLVARFVLPAGISNTDSAGPAIFTGMATRLSDLSIDDLRATLRATEASAGRNCTSARIIRRELQRKVEEEQARKQSSNSTNTLGRAAP